MSAPHDTWKKQVEGASCPESTLYSLMDYYLRDHGFPPGSLPLNTKTLKYILEPFCWSDVDDRINSYLVNFVETYPLPPLTMGLDAAEINKEVQKQIAQATAHGMNLKTLFPTMWSTHLAGLRAGDAATLREVYTEWNLLLRDTDPTDHADRSHTRLIPKN